MKLSLENNISKENPYKICFVCLGNICRSPTAEGVFQHLVNDRGLQPYFEVDSSGTSAYHVGESANSKSQQIANQQGLILVDTKYEFGIHNGEVTLMDEVHTADSSRYFYADGYEERLEKGQPQKQLSKEFLREWLMDHNFQGKHGQTLPDLPDEFRIKVYNRYTELFEKLTGQSFDPTPLDMDHFNGELKDIFDRY